jgi:TPR repeat protein
MDKKDMDKAVTLYRLASEQEDPDGLAKLGLCYERAKGVAKDLDEAERLYSRAGTAGFFGLCNLGIMCETGAGVAQHIPRAVQLYKQAADGGHANGQLYLGECYEHAIGVNQDEGEAMRLYHLAFKQEKSARVYFRLGVCHELGRGVPPNGRRKDAMMLPSPWVTSVLRSSQRW